MRHPDFGAVIVSMAVLVGIANLFIYCYFGKMAIESYAKMADCLFECNWHELSPDLQKYLVIMIANAQKPTYYHGFELAVLNLETFTKVRDGQCLDFI